MPISKDAFNKGARSADLERDIVAYLERHPDQALTLEEVGGGIRKVQRIHRPGTLFRFDRACRPPRKKSAS